MQHNQPPVLLHYPLYTLSVSGELTLLVMRSPAAVLGEVGVMSDVSNLTGSLLEMVM